MMSIPHLRRRTAALALAYTAATCLAGPFNGGHVTIVVGGVPGSSFDNAARIIAEPLAKELGVPVVVDNRPGAAMTIAAAYVAKAEPDGRTLLLGATPFVQAPHLQSKPAYDPVASFTPLVQLFDARLWLAVNTAVPAKNVNEFIALARQPGSQFSFSSPGTGSTPHLNMAVLMQQARVELLHVPYKSIPPAVLDVATGRVSAVFASYSDLLPYVQTGKLRILASTGAKRSDLSRDVPSFREAGWAGFDEVGFGGLLAPAGTPAALASEIARSAQNVMLKPEVKARLFVLGLEPVDASTQSAFGRVVREQTAFWKKIITDFGIKTE